MKKKKKLSAFSIINFIILATLSLLCVIPFINLLAVSFSSSAAVSAGNVAFWPKDFTLAAYEFAFKGGKFLKSLGVAFERVGLGLRVNMALMILTAYPLSKSKTELAGRNIYAAYFIITMLIGGGMIPTYLVVVKAGLKDSIWSLILPGGLPVYNMLILMNFMRGLPKEIEEAAEIDGASKFQILVRVILPVLKPALATVGLFCVVWHWNDWFSGMIYMNDPTKYPLQTYLHYLLTDFEEMMQRSNGNYTQILSMMNARTGRAAQLFLGALPIMLFYPVVQPYFTKGLVLGSVKG